MGISKIDRAFDYTNIYGIAWRQKINQMVIYLDH